MTIQEPCLILVRHSESVGNLDSNHYREVPDWKVQLTQKGLANAAELGGLLSNVLLHDLPIKVISSPYVRAQQTSIEIINSFKVRGALYSEDPRLREQSWGNYSEFINPHTLAEKQEYGEFFYQIAGGESVAQVYDRAVQFMHSLGFSAYPTIIVSHGIFLRTLTMYLNKVPAKNFHTVERLGNCDADVYSYDIFPEGKRIKKLCGIRNLQIV